MRRFVTNNGVGAFPHLADVDAEIWQDFGIGSQPAFAFINDDGTVAEIVIGSLGVDGLTDRMNSLIDA